MGTRPALTDSDRRLLAAIQQGLPLAARPYAEIAARLGWGEAEVIGRLRALLELGVIKRMGIVVRHHELGYRANAMVVWDVPDDRVDALGTELGRFAFVTLCYRRARRPPEWPYNLYSMIHAHDRATALAHIDELVEQCGLADVPRAVLFSRQRFKQRGAWYDSPTCGDGAAAGRR